MQNVIEKITNETIQAIEAELAEAKKTTQKTLDALEQKRLAALRAEGEKRGIVAKDLTKLRATDGSRFISQGVQLNSFGRAQAERAIAKNDECAYHCHNCGWVKGRPTNDPSGDNRNCLVCERIVEFY